MGDPARVQLRRRKAWEVRCTWQDPWEKGDIVFAPTSAKAKAQLVSRLDDCGYEGNLWVKVRCRRAEHADMLLPPPHPIAERMTKEDMHIVLHAFGGTGLKAGYRSHFVTDPSDLQLLRLSWEDGLFRGPLSHPGDNRNPHDGTPDSASFLLTNLGKEVARSMQPTYPDYA